MGWPITFSCFPLLQPPGLSQFLSSFSDPSCQPGSCASALCLLPIASQISASNTWHALLPGCPLTRELILPALLFNEFPVTGRTAFSQGSSQPRAPAPPVFKDVSRCVPCTQDQAPLVWASPPLWNMAICTWRYNISHPPGNFCPCSGTSAFLKFNFSVACRPAKDSILYWCTHFDTGAPSKLPCEVSTPSPEQGKMTGKWLKFYEQIFKYVQIFLLPRCIIGIFERSLTPAV